MYLSVQFTIASAGKVLMRARRTERRPSGESWAIWPGSPIKGLPGYTILSLIIKVSPFFGRQSSKVLRIKYDRRYRGFIGNKLSHCNSLMFEK
jgi:hypothetical protein